jgi:hypothetical protein
LPRQRFVGDRLCAKQKKRKITADGRFVRAVLSKPAHSRRRLCQSERVRTVGLACDAAGSVAGWRWHPFFAKSFFLGAFSPTKKYLEKLRADM